MPIESLSIDGFRNIEPVHLKFSSRFNLFIGENAAGKTSLLEALYVLSRGRSFRSRYLDKLVQRDAASFQLLARLAANGDRTIPVGMQRSAGRLVCRVDGQAVKRLSDMASLIPVQWVGGNLHALIDDGPATRRQMIDWGLFHVKPDYIVVWKQFQNLLKQRNAALRQGRPAREVQVWDRDLGLAAERLHQYRAAYLESLQPIVTRLRALFPVLTHELVLNYRKGWLKERAYAEQLKEGLESDCDKGFTQSGPQRAELELKYGDKSARDGMSRGQQKLLVTTLLAAQSTLLFDETGKKSLFLLDDLGAELDSAHQQRVFELLAGINAQVFITAISESLCVPESQSMRRFHVKHGRVSEMV